MILFKQGRLSQKEETEISGILAELSDVYGDLYITRDNIRLYVKENSEILFESLKLGNPIAFSYEEGIAFIDGYADNAKRKYLKILARDDNSASKLLAVINSNVKDTLFCKLKKNNPLVKILKDNNFNFKGSRGVEVLLIKENKYVNAK